MKLDIQTRLVWASTFLSTSKCAARWLQLSWKWIKFNAVRYSPFLNARCAANELFLQQRLQFYPSIKRRKKYSAVL